MAEPRTRVEMAQSLGLAPGPFYRRIVPSSIVYRTNVVDDVSRPDWMLTPNEIHQFEADYGRKWEKWEDSPVRALGKIRTANLREWIGQERAMNAPFLDMARQRFSARAVAVGGDAAGAAARGTSDGARGAAPLLAGLVTSKTKATTVEKIEIDRIASRIKRLRKAVQNGAHALDANAHIEHQGYRWRRLFVTLTYREIDEWEPKHIKRFADAVRVWFKRHAGVRMRMQWVLELQKRGAVHYHCMIWVPAHLRMPTPDKQGWWKWGQSNVKTMPGGIQRPVSYMAKYASKVDAGQCSRVPKGARMHGSNGLDDEGKRWVRWWRAPLFARDALGGAADIRKVLGGYMDKLTGEFHASPWKVTITPAGRVFAWRELPALIN